MWSLTERPGFLRMRAYKPIIADRIDTAGNSLVQRSYKTEANIVKTKFDISGMADGQNAGLHHSSSDLYGGLGVRMYGGRKYIYAYGSGGVAEHKAAVPDGVNEVYFKSEWYINMQSTLYYSFDGTAYVKSHAYAMQWHRYRGDYVGFFNYNNSGESGYIDIDYFTYDFPEKVPFENKMMAAADSIVVDTKYLGVGVRVPTRGLFGSKISWTCDDETAVIDSEPDIYGRIWIRIKRPKEGVKKVTLKAELSVEEETKETYCACFEVVMPFGYSLTHTGKNTVGVPAENMAFEDPLFDGAADPTLVYNRGTKEWWIFYTQRRASVDDEPDFHWVFGSEIGIAKSADGGSTWEYAGTAKGLSLSDDRDTFWAPEVIYNNGVYHMYLSYVRGRPGTAVQSSIEHYTSCDLINWKHESKLPAPYTSIIDPCVFRLEDGKYAMWFKNQNRRSVTSVFYSDDLYNWSFGREDIGIGGRKEAPNVFYWNGQYNMILDFDKRLTLFTSKDGYNWSDEPTDIGGQHGDVVNQNGKAILVYFAENYNSTQGNKTALYINELLIKENGTVWCDHTAHFNVKLNAPEIRKMEIKKLPAELVFEEGASLELSGLELSVQFADSMGDTLTPADFEEYSITAKLVPGNESGKGEIQISVKYGGTVAIPVTFAERR
jgi:hypothetical protein